jgi:NAD(P)-dependent dehydrogenase (short-subunit alcohol dehydrogenase family)
MSKFHSTSGLQAHDPYELGAAGVPYSTQADYLPIPAGATGTLFDPERLTKGYINFNGETPMSASYGALSTTDEVLAGRDLKGKRVFVTGVSSGLGVETARALAAHGAQVVGAARDRAKAEAATGVVRDAATNGGGIEVVALDLASLASVRACADTLLAVGRPFDVVIANAGVAATPFGRTADGFEMQFGTNHLGHFVLVNRIASLMRPGSRLVVLSSTAHRTANVDLNDPNFEHRAYDPLIAYGQSKTANALFAVEFDRRYHDRGVRATAVHPGVINTGLSRHMDPAWFEQINAGRAAQGKPLFQPKSVAQGAATSVWAGFVALADAIGGQYCEDCHVTTRLFTAVDDGVEEGVRAYALDPSAAAALWKKSEALVAESF